jgi:hypothetical protein
VTPSDEPKPPEAVPDEAAVAAVTTTMLGI